MPDQMTIAQYQNQTHTTAVYIDECRRLAIHFVTGNKDILHHDTSERERTRIDELTNLLCLCYTAIGLGGESGEILNKIKKIIRDGQGVLNDDHRSKIAAEMGGSFYYHSQLANHLSLDIETILHDNAAELASRKERGKIQGDGDDR